MKSWRRMTVTMTTIILSLDSCSQFFLTLCVLGSASVFLVYFFCNIVLSVYQFQVDRII